MSYKQRGLYLEEFIPGAEFFTAARTVTEADVAAFAGLSGDFNPLHTDEEFAKTTPFGTRIAQGMLGVIVFTGLINQLGIVEGTTIAFLESNERFLSPIRIGDTIHGVIKVLESKPSSKPGRGVVKLECSIVNARGEVAVAHTETLLVKAQG